MNEFLDIFLKKERMIFINWLI